MNNLVVETEALPFLQLIDHVRASGLTCPTQAVRLFAEALAEIRAASLADVVAAARPTLCSSAEELALLDAALEKAFEMEYLKHPSVLHSVPALPEHDCGPDGEGDWALEGAASLAEISQKPIPLLHNEEQTAMLALMDRVVRAPATPRMFSAARGRLDRADLHRMAQNIVRFDGDLPAIPYLRRGRRPVDLHIAVDISGSMKAYAPTLLTFALLLQRHYSGRTASFALGTECLPLAGHAGADTPLDKGGATPETLLAGSRILTAAHGGTNLGGSLAALADHALKSRSSRRQLLVFSDGWDAGDITELRQVIVRLRRLYTTIVWANPHAAVPGFRPIQQGMATVMPHLDHLVSGHSLAALEEVLALLTRTASQHGGPFSPE